MSKQLDEAVEKLAGRIADLVSRAAYGGGGPSRYDRLALADAIRALVREATIDAHMDEV